MPAEKTGRLLAQEWRELLAVHARTICELDRELHAYGLGASDFEVLDILAEKGADDRDRALRVQELAARIHLSQSALSRLIGRLEKDGLVTRGMCSEDRRGVSVSITGTGRDRHAEVLPIQRAVLARTLGERPAR
ncbi:MULTISPECIES: MarR family transcriptional regulator [unclassified Streptomyces]|uniref:MarR family winged helix-turn-helix transcriptional regulator n=1 Tax=unclassified Streptomyces TaxID=2593676 RepID=UPI002E3165E2|nr:MarR family transcriptional regulator [Streptomyces sp. NBC_01431]